MNEPLPLPFIETRPEARRAEQAATECLEACRVALGLAEIPLPVPVERWVESVLGIDFGFERIAPMDGTLVLGRAEPDRRVIRVDESLVNDDPRLRWTIAHELGHVMLHTEVSETMQAHTTVELLESSPIEQQADRFAGAFLMPAKSIVSVLFNLCSTHELDPALTIPDLMGSSEVSVTLWRSIFLPGICEAFGVSRYGALHRLADLRLFDDAPLLLPRHVFKLVK